MSATTRDTRASNDLSNYFPIEPSQESAMQNDIIDVRSSAIDDTWTNVTNGDKWEDR